MRTLPFALPSHSSIPRTVKISRRPASPLGSTTLIHICFLCHHQPRIKNQIVHIYRSFITEPAQVLATPRPRTQAASWSDPADLIWSNLIKGFKQQLDITHSRRDPAELLSILHQHPTRPTDELTPVNSQPVPPSLTTAALPQLEPKLQRPNSQRNFRPNSPLSSPGSIYHTQIAVNTSFAPPIIIVEPLHAPPLADHPWPSSVPATARPDHRAASRATMIELLKTLIGPPPASTLHSCPNFFRVLGSNR